MQINVVAHEIAEALEAANPTGVVIGEAERAIIRDVLQRAVAT